MLPGSRPLGNIRREVARHLDSPSVWWPRALARSPRPIATTAPQGSRDHTTPASERGGNLASSWHRSMPDHMHEPIIHRRPDWEERHELNGPGEPCLWVLEHGLVAPGMNGDDISEDLGQFR